MEVLQLVDQEQLGEGPVDLVEEVELQLEVEQARSKEGPSGCHGGCSPFGLQAQGLQSGPEVHLWQLEVLHLSQSVGQMQQQSAPLSPILLEELQIGLPPVPHEHPGPHQSSGRWSHQTGCSIQVS